MKKASDFKTAKTYAISLYKSVQSAEELEIVLHDVELLQDVNLMKIDELSYLCSPIVKPEDKSVIIEEIAHKLNLCRQTGNMLNIMVENKHFKILNQVLIDFISIYNQQNNIAEITVETVMDLSKDQNKLLQTKLADLFKKEIKIKYELNPEILGGLVIKNGTMLIDLSLKNKLKNLEQLMKGTD